MGSPADFDFWLGTWRAVWGDDDAHGTNTITKEYGDRVVYERFDGRPGAEFTGMSVSVYDEQEDCGTRPGSTTRATTSISPAASRTAR